MKRKLKVILLATALLAGVSMLQAQELRKKWAIQMNVQHQDLPISFYVGQLGVVDQVNIRPLYTLEGQRFFYKNDRRRRFVSIKGGFYNNLYHERWTSFQVGLGSEWNLFKGLFVGLRGEMGAASVKNADIQYQYENGKWVEIRNPEPATVDVLLTARMDLGYRILNGSLPLDIIGNGQVSLHNNSVFEAFVPYTALGFGIRLGF